MTTFGYAYHADSREILEGRRAFAKIKAIMCALDGKAYDTANDLVGQQYVESYSRNMLTEMLLRGRSLAQSISYPYNPSPFQAQLDAQRRAMAQSSGLLGGIGAGIL